MQLPVFESQILDLINQHRRSLGLSPLVAQEDITLAASQHSQKMATAEVGIGHDGFEQRAGHLIRLLDGLTAAENVAYGQNTAEEVVKSWLASDGHRQNIEGQYNYTGLAVAVKEPTENGTDSEPRNVFTQIFVAVPTAVETILPTPDELALDIFKEINQHRQAADLQPLLLDEDIQAAASEHSRRMAQNIIPLGYDGLREKLIALAQNLKARAVAANIAQAKPQADKIVETWLNSAAHCANIEGNYSRTGVGVAQNEAGDFYITQLFLLC